MFFSPQQYYGYYMGILPALAVLILLVPAVVILLLFTVVVPNGLIILILLEVFLTLQWLHFALRSLYMIFMLTTSFVKNAYGSKWLHLNLITLGSFGAALRLVNQMAGADSSRENGGCFFTCSFCTCFSAFPISPFMPPFPLKHKARELKPREYTPQFYKP